MESCDIYGVYLPTIVRISLETEMRRVVPLSARLYTTFANISGKICHPPIIGTDWRTYLPVFNFSGGMLSPNIGEDESHPLVINAGHSLQNHVKA
ncbi:MAG: hypothetical protein ACYDAM_12310, partial [Leptospirales bacterium]